MPNIRPVSDLRNNFAEITKEAQLSGEPIFLTKNGVGSLVVMSMESYEQNRYDSMIYDKLREAGLENKVQCKRDSQSASTLIIRFQHNQTAEIDRVLRHALHPVQKT